MLRQGLWRKMVTMISRNACTSSALWISAVLVGLLPRFPVDAQELIVRFGTGGDDLRGGNDNVHLVLLLRTGAPIRFDNVNGLNRWPGNSSQRVVLPLPETFKFQDVVGVRLETTFSGGIGGDNWNLDHLQVTAQLGRESCLLFDQSGVPLFRFTGEQRVRQFRAVSDPDSDGLPECWESALGLSSLKANLILVPVLEPRVTREEVQPALNKVVDFFARMPNRNPDGSTGIDVLIQWGASLTDLDGDLRVRGIPVDLIGKGHGVLIGPGTGGGGGTGHSDWSGSTNNWHSIVHELGHQLGLDHGPRLSGIPSPLYTSIMNYDYSYQFNGDPNAVHFSSGKFRSVSLDERNLNETLSFTRGDLEFLSQEPYHFGIQAAGPGSTNVDFNRNGVFGENGLRADVNGGTAVTARNRTDFAETAGGFVLTTFQGQLVAVYSDLLRPISWSGYTEAGLSARNVGRLRYQIYAEDRLSSPRNLVATGVTGDPHALEAFGYLFATFPTTGGYSVRSYEPGSTAGSLRMTGLQSQPRAPLSHPILVRTSDPEELYLFIWDEATKRVRYRKVMASASGEISFGPVADLNMNRGGAPIRSNSPVGGIWNPRTRRITLVTTERNGSFQGRMKMIDLTWGRRRWLGEAERWVMGTSDAAATLSRPTLLFDDRPSAGRDGQYLLYNLWERSGSDATLTELIRLNPNPAGGIWTKQLMQNVWTTTRSAPSAVLYQNDVAWGWRVNETFPVVPNILQVFLQASGVTDDIRIADHDDVDWIATQGLRESLRNVSISR